MSVFWIYGERIAAKVLKEYSLTDLRVEFYRTDHAHAIRPLDKDDIAKLEGKFVADGLSYRIVWARAESDDRGAYIAVALRMGI